jgi:mono/diheme cytochrome c family protein
MMKQNKYLTLALLILLGLLLAACGRRELPPQGGAAQSEAGAPTVTPVAAATPLQAQFKQPTLVKKETDSEAEEKAETKESTPTPGVDLSRGERIYSNNNCDQCHGPQGEGVEGEGNPLAGAKLSEEEFTDILRTGGKGALGNDHLYGTQAISPSGMEALYAFVASLGQP